MTLAALEKPIHLAAQLEPALARSDNGTGSALGPVVMRREGAPAPGSRVLSFQWVLCVCESECAD
jgi:hypothetical protein